MNKVTIHFSGQGGRARSTTFFTDDPVEAVLDGVGGATQSGALYLVKTEAGKILAIPGRSIQEISTEDVPS